MLHESKENNVTQSHNGVISIWMQIGNISSQFNTLMHRSKRQ